MSRDTSFYYSFLVLPPRKRSAIVAVWDFCRAVDDAVDEREGEAARRELAEWRRELAAVYEGEPHRRQAVALRPYAREFNLPREHFETLLDGVEMDLSHAEYPTFAALTGYCYRVASAVGLICIEIFGYRDQRTREYAVSLGLALQLTNIIRDVAADLARGRIYLPAEDLQRFGVTAGDLRAGRVTPAIKALLQFECDRARDCYRQAAAALPRVDARGVLAAEIMGAIYYEILCRIERSGYDVFSQRIRVPRPYRAVLALRLWLKALLP